MKQKFSYVVCAVSNPEIGNAMNIEAVYSSFRAAKAHACCLRTQWSSLLHDCERRGFPYGSHNRFPEILIKRYVTNSALPSDCVNVGGFRVSRINDPVSAYKYGYREI